MKNLKNGRWLIVLCVVFFSTNALAMFITTEKGPLVGRGMQQEMQRQRRTNQYFLYGKDDSNNGIWVDKEFIKANCEALRDMIADFGATQEVKIPIGLFPIAVIKLGFDVLANKVNIPNLAFADLIDVANIFNFLGVSADKMKPVLDRILDNLSKISDEELKKLNPDVQKLLMIDPTINYLKDCIIKDYSQKRKQVLIHQSDNINAVAFSPDGKKIVSGSAVIENSLILWDISNSNNITHQALVGHPKDVYAVAYSPDGKYIVSGGGGLLNNLIVWNITDPNNITHQSLVGHPSYVISVAFSPDGKRIVSGCGGFQNNLIVWDISNPNNITHQVLVGHPRDVFAVAFSSDGKRIVSGCSGIQNNLIVWDMSNPNKITHQVLVGHPRTVMSVAFSGERIVSGCLGVQNNLIVWDVSDSNNITHQDLVGHPYEVAALAFSPDGKSMVSGCLATQNNLIVWDMSNPNKITHQVLVGHSRGVNSAAWSSDGKRMVSGGLSARNSLILWTLLTDQEDSLLKQLTDYNADQMRLIYGLCRKALTG